MADNKKIATYIEAYDIGGNAGQMPTQENYHRLLAVKSASTFNCVSSYTEPNRLCTV